MIIDYDIVWTEAEKMNFRQFSYEIEKETIPLTSYLPDDLYKFYKDLTDKNFPVIVFAGERDRGSGVLKYCRAEPVY